LACHREMRLQSVVELREHLLENVFSLVLVQPKHVWLFGQQCMPKIKRNRFDAQSVRFSVSCNIVLELQRYSNERSAIHQQREVNERGQYRRIQIAARNRGLEVWAPGVVRRANTSADTSLFNAAQVESETQSDSDH